MHVGNMEKDGHPFKADFCCYKVITRVQEDELNYTKNADKLIKWVISNWFPDTERFYTPA
jgi:hypothetical protein